MISCCGEPWVKCVATSEEAAWSKVGAGDEEQSSSLSASYPLSSAGHGAVRCGVVMLPWTLERTLESGGWVDAPWWWMDGWVVSWGGVVVVLPWMLESGGWVDMSSWWMDG